jgi:hypothetical protein
VALQAVDIEKTSPTGKFEEVAPYVSGKRGREVFLNGDPDFGVWTAGQVIGLIHDIPTNEELLRRIEREAVETMKKNQALYVEEGQKPVAEGASVGKKENNPGAEIWGIGKSKL